MKKLLFPGLIFLAVVSLSRAVDLKQSKVTQVVNDVQIISAASQSKKTASVNDNFDMPDILRTGDASRAELVAADETVTRVGANTIFSFDPANRTIDLKQGSLLFHSPHGKGGGTIHTGSATASVLGSTLIVVATPNGGFKVLALEDEAEIKFLNGLKQKLLPGQMTFILPGGDKLAPVLIFRLDSLTQNSLLVKGFNSPLASLPLIQNQIDKQLKLLSSGKATDTGLYAGDDATSSQVEVLDLNSIKNNLNSAKTALNADATISQPSLTDASVPTPPNHVFPANSFQLENNTYFGNQIFGGFAARNIFFNPNLISLNVNMGPYAGMSDFDFVAAHNLNLQGQVTFTGLSDANRLFLFGGDQINIASGSSIRADCKDFELSAPGALTLDSSSLENSLGHIALDFNSDVTVQNHSSFNAAGNLTIKSLGNLTFSGSTADAGSIFFSPLAGTLTVDNSTLTTDGHVIFLVANAANISGSTIDSGDFVIGGGQVAPVTVNNSTIKAHSGSLKIAVASSVNINNSSLTAANTVEIDSANVSVQNTSISAQFLTLNSGDGILLDGDGAPPISEVHSQNLSRKTGLSKAASKFVLGVIPTRKATLNAANTININNYNLAGYGEVNMTANTITLNGVAFGAGSVDNFGTQTGQVNVNGTQIPGGVNFYNSSYGGTAITSASQINLTSGPGTAPGMYSYAK